MLVIPIGDENPTRRFAFFNYAFIAISIFVWLFINFRQNFEEIVFLYGFIPGDISVDRLAAHMFMHVNFFHLAGNMLYLWIVGDNVEDVLGHFWFIVFYMTSGLAAAFTQTLIAPYHNMPMIGASGAIAGIIGFYLVFFPWRKIKFFYWIYLAAGTFTMTAVWTILMWFGMQLLYVALLPSSGSGGGIAFWAHIGGFVYGVAVAGVCRLGMSVNESKTVDSIQGRPVMVEPVEVGAAGGPNEILAKDLGNNHEAVFIHRYLNFTRMYGERQIEPQYHVKAGEIFVKSENLDRAVSVFENYLRAYPRDKSAPKVRYTLALIYMYHVNNPYKGIHYLTQAVQYPGEGYNVEEAKALLEELRTKN